MKKLFIAVCVVTTLLMAATVSYAESCEESGGCTLSGGGCGVECNGECLPYDEARCCMSGMCYRDGSWCGGVECNGECLPYDEARCCMSGMCYRDGSWCGGVECNGECMTMEEARCCMNGCNYVNGACDCGESR